VVVVEVVVVEVVVVDVVVVDVVVVDLVVVDVVVVEVVVVDVLVESTVVAEREQELTALMLAASITSQMYEIFVALQKTVLSPVLLQNMPWTLPRPWKAVAGILAMVGLLFKYTYASEEQSEKKLTGILVMLLSASEIFVSADRPASKPLGTLANEFCRSERCARRVIPRNELT
jgi:hypothetical protein